MSDFGCRMSGVFANVASAGGWLEAPEISLRMRDVGCRVSLRTSQALAAGSGLPHGCGHPASVGHYFFRGGLGSWFACKSAAVTSHLAPPAGTSTLALQRIAFTIIRRNSGMPQLLW